MPARATPCRLSLLHAPKNLMAPPPIFLLSHRNTLMAGADPPSPTLYDLSFPLDRKVPKNQGRLNRSSPRMPKRLTSRSGSDFCEVKRKRPSVKVKRLVIPCPASPHGGHASPFFSSTLSLMSTPIRHPTLTLQDPHCPPIFLLSHRNTLMAGADPQIEDST